MNIHTFFNNIIKESNFNKRSLGETMKGLIIGSFIVIGTFPGNQFTYSTGIDSPITWIFNTIYEKGLQFGQHIIFPHGPLAFFMYPLHQNILLVTVVVSLLKILLVFNVSTIMGPKNSYKWISIFIFVYFIASIAGFTHLVLINIILLYCSYYLHEKYKYKIIAFILTAFSIYVMSYVAIISIVLFLSFSSYYLILKFKNYKRIALDCIVLLLLICLFWLIMYRSLSGFTGYLLGMANLAQDNSAGAANYPYNNWYILSLALALTFSISFINRSKASIFFGTLITLSLFAAWKHGMAREDISHVRGFINYVMFSLSIFLIFTRIRIFQNFVLSIIAIFLFYINMSNAIGYSSSQYELLKVNSFVDFFTKSAKSVVSSNNETMRNIAINKLPQGFRDSIKNSTVDIYPWDYSIIPANNLNWVPRPVIQSYTSYTHYLDNLNSEHFSSIYAPEYIIWELNKITKDCNGSDFNSIDNRYLLNDEPLTIIQMLKRYEYFCSSSKFLILKKRKFISEETSSIIGIKTMHWGEWIDVPINSSKLLRAKMTFKRSFLEQLKSLAYKDEQFWVYLKLDNGLIYKYKIVPKNAEDGIWVNPFIYDTKRSYRVRQICFVCSNKRILSQSLTTCWEEFDFGTTSKSLKDFFNIDAYYKDTVILNSTNTFEQNIPNWSDNTINSMSDQVYSGRKSHLVKPQSFSSTFSYNLDSLPFGELKIVSDCWAKSDAYNYTNDAMLVISIDDYSNNIVWNAISIDEQLIDNTQWNHIINNINYKHNKPNCKLKCYLYNTSNKEILVDDFRVVLLNN